VFERVEIRLLNRILGIGVGVEDPTGNAIEALAVAPNEDLEELCLAGEYPSDDAFVGGQVRRDGTGGQGFTLEGNSLHGRPPWRPLNMGAANPRERKPRASKQAPVRRRPQRLP
jgi:hypothetical protein